MNNHVYTKRRSSYLCFLKFSLFQNENIIDSMIILLIVVLLCTVQCYVWIICVLHSCFQVFFDIHIQPFAIHNFYEAVDPISIH